MLVREQKKLNEILAKVPHYRIIEKTAEECIELGLVLIQKLNKKKLRKKRILSELADAEAWLTLYKAKLSDDDLRLMHQLKHNKLLEINKKKWQGRKNKKRLS